MNHPPLTKLTNQLLPRGTYPPLTNLSNEKVPRIIFNLASQPCATPPFASLATSTPTNTDLRKLLSQRDHLLSPHQCR